MSINQSIDGSGGKVHQDHKRSIKVTFRISPAEERLLNQRCQGVKHSRYIRAGLFNYPRPRPRPVIPQVNRDTYVELSRIGHNLNQQTKAIHEALAMKLITGFSDAYLNELRTLRDLVQQLQVEISCPDHQIDEEKE